MSKLVILTLLSLILSNSWQSIIAIDCQGHPPQREAQLRQFALCDYDPLLPPVLDHKSTIIIKNFNIILRSFEFEEYTGTLHLYTWLKMNWKDEHLSWDAHIFDDIDRINVTPQDIWIPDVYLDQSTDGNIVTKASNIDCVARNNGNVSCTIPIAFNVLCTANYTNWPHDSQKCRLNFITWSYLAEQVDFDNDTLSFDVSEVHESKQWKILKTEVVGRWAAFWDEDQSNVGIEFDIYLQRIEREAQVVFIIPTILLSLLNIVTMLIKLDSKSRLILAAINIMTQFTHNNEHAWSATFHTDSIPTLFDYFKYSYLITMLLIIETTLLSIFKGFEVTLPTWANFPLEIFSTNRFAQVFLTYFDWMYVFKSPEQNNNKTEGAWTILLKIIDRLLMVTMIIAYCTMFKLLLPTMESDV